MSLGVLNNVSAIYAENNLNNTSNSLSNVLQQLSSGSRINSGADDAAGLSLVDGLQANSQALAQSQTNVSEGVGLLKVADGALSQVTNLLNRAVTLATEVSNGTLNGSQETSANQEYQSILSEISNIGATTTYNQQTVFDSTTSIYTGDSSTAGSSIDSLSISSLSSSNVGDTNGVMSYSNGQNNVFINLSTATTNATGTDALSGASTTLNVAYTVAGGNSTATTAITVGGSSGYANTVNGLISAINNSGLGLTATLATQSQAGVQGGGSQTGIEITGGLVAAGVAPSNSSTSGTLDLAGLSTGATLALGATVTVNEGSNSHVFTIDKTDNTLANLANVISNTSGLGVSATVVTNGDGTQSLSLADAANYSGALSVSTTSGTTQTPQFGSGSTGTTMNVATGTSTVSGTAYQASSASTITVGSGTGTELGTDVLTLGSSITIVNTIANDTQTQTFVIGGGTDTAGATATHYTNNTTGNGSGVGETLQGLANSINALNSTLGLRATVTSSGLTLSTATYNSGTSTWTATQTTGQNVSVTANNLSAAATTSELQVYNPTVAGQTQVAGTKAVTVLDDGTGNNVTGDTLTGSITLTNSYGSTTFTAGAGTDTASTVYLGNWGGSTYTGLAAAINHYSSTLGYGAAWSATAGTGGNPALVLTANNKGNNAITVTGTPTLTDSTDATTAVSVDSGGTGATAGTNNVVATSSTAILQLGSGNITDSGANASVLGGAISLTFNSNTQVFIMGAQPTNGTAVAGAIYTGANTVQSLVNAINSAGGLGLEASAPGGGTGGIYLQGGQGISSAITLNSVATSGTETPLAVINNVGVNGSQSTMTGSGSTAATGAAGNNAVFAITGGQSVNTNDVMAGSVSITNGGVTDTFVMGSGTDVTTGASRTYYTANHGDNSNTLANLATMITADSSRLNVTAQANTSGLTLTQNGTTGTYAGGNISATSSLTDVTAQTPSSATTQNLLASESDTLSGALVFSVGSGASVTVKMSDVTGAGQASTVQGLINYINANSSTGRNLGISASWVADGTNPSFGSIKLTSLTQGSSGTVNVNSALTSLVDTAGGSALTYTAISGYNTGLSGSVEDVSSGQSAAAGMVSNQKAGSGIATISYSHGAGQSLSETDLTSQANARAALTALNAAISDVAAMDGYIGAQINTLNAVSSVLSTQAENVMAAQNAVQATDYASAVSNMSKYEILSQTGIAALAQANTMQQEVIKLLQ